MPDSRARARRATVLQYASVVMSVVGLLFNLLLSPALKDAELRSQLEGYSLILGGLVIIAAQVCFLMWVHRVVRQLKAQGADIGMSPARAVWMWIIPLLNLVKPYHVMRDIAERVGGAHFVASLPLQWWWAASIVARILDRVEAKLLAREAAPLDDTVSTVVGLLSSVCAVAVALLCVQLLKEIQARLDRRRDGLDEVEGPVAEDVAAAA